MKDKGLRDAFSNHSCGKDNKAKRTLQPDFPTILQNDFLIKQSARRRSNAKYTV
jgi:hypothetical protein